MGYFDDYLEKNKGKSTLQDTTKLKDELKAYGNKSISVDVTENKYGYNDTDVINVARLLHEANAHKISVKTKIDNSPLLYKQTEDSLGNKKIVKRGRYEKKKLLKDAESYEKKMIEEGFPVAEENLYDSNVSMDDVPNYAEQPEEVTETNATYMDVKKIAVSDEEFPEQTDKNKLILNKKDQKYLASQDVELSTMDLAYLSRVSPKTMSNIDSPDIEPSFQDCEISDKMSDEQIASALEFVRNQIIYDSSLTIYKVAVNSSAFVRIDDMDNLLEEVINTGINKIKKSKWKELAFKFRLLSIYYAGINLETLNEDGKTIFLLSKVFTNRAS